jgi:hypothetical protein
MNFSSKVITTQPVFSHLDKTSKKLHTINSHKNSCEKCITCNSTAERCPTTCNEFGIMFMLYEDKADNGSKQFGLYSYCCLPCTLTFNTLFCGSCVIYNVCRNKCANNKESKNYLC